MCEPLALICSALHRFLIYRLLKISKVIMVAVFRSGSAHNPTFVAMNITITTPSHRVADPKGEMQPER